MIPVTVDNSTKRDIILLDKESEDDQSDGFSLGRFEAFLLVVVTNFMFVHNTTIH